MAESVTKPSAPDAQASASEVGTKPNVQGAAAAVEVATTTAIATRYWDECVAYPTGSTASLWLYVNNSWKHLDNPSQGIKDMVQRAFLGSGSNVRVWYNNSAVVGLVVEGT